MKRKTLLLVVVLLMSAMLVACGANTDATDEDVEQGGQDHAHGDYEWIGEFELKEGKYLFHFGECEDEKMDVGFIKMGDNITDLEHHAAHLMATEKEVISQDSAFDAKPDYAYTFEMNKDHGHIHFTIKEDGTYSIVTEHHPEESSMQILDEDGEEILPIREHEGDH